MRGFLAAVVSAALSAGGLPVAFPAGELAAGTFADPLQAPVDPANPGKDDAGAYVAKAGAASVEITSVGDPVLLPGKDLRLTVQISNPTDVPLTLESVDVSTSVLTAVRDRDVSRWMTNESPSTLLANIPVSGTVAPGSMVSRTITMSADKLPWPTAAYEWGPHGIEVRAHASTPTGKANFTDRSFIIAATDADIPAMPIAIVTPVSLNPDNVHTTEGFVDKALSAPVTTAPTADPTPTSATPTEDPSASAEPGTSTAPSDSAEPSESTETPSTEPEDTAPEPDTPDPAATLGPLQRAFAKSAYAASTTIADWDMAGVNLYADPKVAAPNLDAATLYAAPAYDPDLSALAHTNRADLLKTLKNRSASSMAVFSDADVDMRTIEFLAKGGFTAVVVPEKALADQPDFKYTPHAATSIAAAGKNLTVYASDAGMSQAIAGTLESANGLQLNAVDSTQVALAFSAIAYRERPNDPRAQIVQLDRTLLTTPDRHGDLTAQHDSAVALLTAPWLTPTSLTEIEPRADYAARFPATLTTPSEITAKEHDAISVAVTAMDSIAPILPNPEVLRAGIHEEALAMNAVGLRAKAAERTELIAGMNIEARTNSVYVEPSSTINMIAESSALPINVTNDLGVPLTVGIHLTTPDTRLKQSELALATIEPNSTTQVHVPVQAWGSGNLTIRADIVIPNDGDTPTVIGTGQEIDVRVRADWENVGTAVVTGGVVLVLLIGIVQSVRRGRRAEPMSAAEISEQTVPRDD